MERKKAYNLSVVTVKESTERIRRIYVGIRNRA